MQPNVSGDATPLGEPDRQGRRTRWVWGGVVGLLLITAAVSAWFLMDSDSESLEVQHLWSNEDAGVILATEWGSSSPTRVTGTALDPDLVVGDPAGWLWDSTVPDRDEGYDVVDVDGSKKVLLNYTFFPDCAHTDGWDQVDVTIQTDEGERSATVDAPDLPDVVAQWCALPMQVETRGGDHNGCEVEREYVFTNPRGRAATVRVAAPGWQMDDLVIETGQYEAAAVVRSDTACFSPRKPTGFIIQYEDGSADTITLGRQ